MKVQRAEVIVVVMLALLMWGCGVSLSQIRQDEPYRTFTSTKHPKEVAKCIEYKIREEEGARWYESKTTGTVALEEYPDQSYRIAITIPPYSAIADLLVKPSGRGSVVDYRTFLVLNSGREIPKTFCLTAVAKSAA